MKAVCYMRYSPRPDAHHSASIETQLEICRKHAAHAGFKIVGEYADRELSGATMDRPGLQEAMAAVCKHRGVLVFYSLSRLARSVKDALAITEKLQKCGAEICSVTEKIDTTSPQGKLFFCMMAAFAQFEREVIAQRTSDAMLRHQAAGWRMGRHAPYGYRLSGDRLAPDAEEQKVVRKIVELANEGLSPQRISTKLAQAGTPARGKQWHKATIAKILKRCEVFEDEG